MIGMLVGEKHGSTRRTVWRRWVLTGFLWAPVVTVVTMLGTVAALALRQLWVDAALTGDWSYFVVWAALFGIVALLLAAPVAHLLLAKELRKEKALRQARDEQGRLAGKILELHEGEPAYGTRGDDLMRLYVEASEELERAPLRASGKFRRGLTMAEELGADPAVLREARSD